MRVRKHGYPLLAETCSELRGSRDCAAQHLTDSLRPRLGLTEQVIRGVEDQTAAIQVEITQIGLTIPLVDHNLQTAPEIARLDATNGRVHTIQHGDLIGAVVHAAVAGMARAKRASSLTPFGNDINAENTAAVFVLCSTGSDASI